MRSALAEHLVGVVRSEGTSEPASESLGVLFCREERALRGATGTLRAESATSIDWRSVSDLVAEMRLPVDHQRFGELIEGVVRHGDAPRSERHAIESDGLFPSVL